MSTRAEIRHMHLVEGVPKKEVARRLGVNVKTVRRHVRGPDEYPARRTPPRGRGLDAFREEVEALVQEDPRISAKRVGRILEERHEIRHHERTLRRFVKEIRGSFVKPQAYVHRSHLPGETMEIDFGQSWAELDGERRKVFYFVATLPASNAYFAKAYAFERIECLLDGISSALEWFGGLPTRVVFDNSSLAVKKILAGDLRIQNDRFHAFCADWPLKAEFCNPASGWEKGSVERGVEYVRGLCFRPIPSAPTLEGLNEMILAELELDLERRRLRDGRTAGEALAEERAHLCPLPEYRPGTARISSVTADKYAHVRVDRVTYSVPSDLARRTLTAHLFHDRVEIADGDQIVARHARSTKAGEHVLALEHVLRLLEAKPRAAAEATVIRQMGLPACFDALREELRRSRRRSDKEWVQIVGLLVDHSLDSLTKAVEEALASDAPGIGTIRQLIRRQSQPRTAVEPVDLSRRDLASVEVAPAQLGLYGALLGSWSGGLRA